MRWFLVSIEWLRVTLLLSSINLPTHTLKPACVAPAETSRAAAKVFSRNSDLASHGQIGPWGTQNHRNFRGKSKTVARARFATSAIDASDPPATPAGRAPADTSKAKAQAKARSVGLGTVATGVSPRRLVANQMVTSGQCSHTVSAQPDVK